MLGVAALPVAGWATAMVVDAYRWPAETALIEPGLLPLDPGLVGRSAALHVDVSGNGRGLVKLGGGWHQPRPYSRWWRWPKVQSVEKRAQLFLAGPIDRPLDLVLEIEPFPRLGARQEMETWLDGVRLDRRSLRPKPATERITLPPAGLSSGLHSLELRFTHQVVPAEVGISAEERACAARVESVRLEPSEGHTLVEVGLDDSTLTLEGDETIEVPLPPGARAVQLQVDDVAASVEGGSVVVEVLQGTQTSRLAEGPAPDVLNSRIELPAVTRPGWLRLRSLDLPRQQVGIDIERGPAPRSDPRPDIILLTIDTLRADALSLHGYHRSTSPHLDRLAADSVVFERAWSTAAWTAPATKSIHTGLWPEHHGHVRVGSLAQEPPQHPLAERLGTVGYDTLAIVQNPVVGPLYGFERGFDTVYDTMTLSRSATDSADVPWFLWHHLVSRANPDQPLFASIHLVDPHESYRPQGEDRRYAREFLGLLRPWQYQPSYFEQHGLEDNPREVGFLRGLYDGEIRRADRQFGRLRDLLELLGLWDTSLIVVTSDHGEEFGEHGAFGHSRTLYEPLVRVPLMVRFPGGRHGGERVRARVSLVDIAPTIGEVVGLEPVASDGVSLVTPESVPIDRLVLAETRPHWDPSDPGSVSLQAVARGSIKCIRSLSGSEGPGLPVPALRVFDLDHDPLELSPLDPNGPEGLACHSWLDSAFPTVLANPTRVELSPEDAAQLRALGYL